MNTEWDIDDVARLPNGVLKLVVEVEMVEGMVHLRLVNGEGSVWVRAADCVRIA